MACTVHTALHSTEQPLLQLTNNTLFLLLFFLLPPFLFFLLFQISSHPSLLSLHVLTIPLFLSLCRLFPESLRWLLATQHYRRSKAMMLRIARKNQVNTTTEPSGVFTGEAALNKNELSKNPFRYECILSLFTSQCKLF